MKRILGITVLTLAAVMMLCSFSFSADGMPAKVTPDKPIEGKFSITPKIGTEFDVGGDFVKSGSTTTPPIMGLTVSVNVASKSFGDVYNTPVKGAVDFGYGVTNQLEVLLGLYYLEASSKSFTVGTWSISPAIATGSITGKFNDYNEFGITAGGRYFFFEKGPFNPYASVDIGAKNNNAITLSINPVLGVPIPKIDVYKEGWSVTTGLGLGFGYDLSKSVALGLETGFRYGGSLNSTNSSGSNGGERYSIPLMGALTVRF